MKKNISNLSDKQLMSIYLMFNNEEFPKIEDWLKDHKASTEISNVKLLHKIANQISQTDFITAYRTQELPTLKLSTAEQEQIKGGFMYWSAVISFVIDLITEGPPCEMDRYGLPRYA